MPIAYLPRSAMRKAADLYPGQAKTDAGNAFVIAETARTMPHTLRPIDPSKAGNRRLKNAPFRSAWVASCLIRCRRYITTGKRAEGKRHNAAVMCRARRRLNVLFAMVKHGVFYEQTTPTAA